MVLKCGGSVKAMATAVCFDYGCAGSVDELSTSCALDLCLSSVDAHAGNVYNPVYYLRVQGMGFRVQEVYDFTVG